MKNSRYFFREALTIVRQTSRTILLGGVALVFVFLLVQLTFNAWCVGRLFSETLGDAARIDVYYDGNINPHVLGRVLEDVEDIPGVVSVTAIDAEEAYARMHAFLEQEADLLETLGENPFDPYLEVHVALNAAHDVATSLEQVKGVTYVRDNRALLERLNRLTQLLGAGSLIMVLAISTMAFVLTGQVVRSALDLHRETRRTLVLLGAPDRFIHTPFYMVGVSIPVLAALCAVGLSLPILSRSAIIASEIFAFSPIGGQGPPTTAIALGTVGFSIVLGLGATALTLKRETRATS